MKPIALRICVDVPDVDLALKFYCDGLGLRVGRRLGRSWVELLGATSPIDLLRTNPGTTPAPEVKAPRDFGRHWTPVHLDFVVDHLTAAVERAVAAGATLDREVREEPYGRIANLADPFGHGICLLELSESGYDGMIAAAGDRAR